MPTFTADSKFMFPVLLENDTMPQIGNWDQRVFRDFKIHRINELLFVEV